MAFLSSSLEQNHVSIFSVVGDPLNSSASLLQIRLAYVHYRYNKKMLKAEDLQDILGGNLTSVSITLKEALERVGEIDYNKQQAN